MQGVAVRCSMLQRSFDIASIFQEVCVLQSVAVY